MKNNHLLKISIKEIFNEFSLKLVSNTSPHEVPNFPNEYDIPLFRLNTDRGREKGAKEFLLSTNHFRVIDSGFFLPNLADNLIFEDLLCLIALFDSVRICYVNNQLTLYYEHLLDETVLSLLENKYFMEQFPKDFQVKFVFVNDQNKIDNIKENLAFLILNKINDLGFKEKIFIDLPKLVVKELMSE
jgi:hypothetical protein